MEEIIFNQEFFHTLNTMKLVTKKTIHTGMSGARKSNAKGTSVEFSDFREYMLGDDVRRIDWNAYARMDRLFIKLFMEEKEGRFDIFLDTSASMNYGAYKKSVFALRIAGLFCYSVLSNMDRLILHNLCENKVETSKSVTGKQGMGNLLKQLEQTTFSGNVMINQSLRTMALKTRGVSILISDFLAQEHLEEAIKYLLYQKQDIILVQILAREEIEPDGEGNLRLIDMESLGDLKVTISPKMIKEYKERLRQFIEQLTSMAKKYQLAYIQLVSDEPLERFLYEGIHTGRFLA